MTTRTIDERLTDSAGTYLPSPTTVNALDRVVFETQAAAAKQRMRRRRRPFWFIPGALLVAAALSAGAVVVDDLLHPDLRVPITYVISSGETVSCTAQIRYESLLRPEADAVIDRYKSYDFSDVGQRVHDYARVLTGDEAATPAVMPKSSLWAPEDNFLTDSGAFSISLTSFLLIDVGIGLDIDDDGSSGGTSLTHDCSGKLR